MTTNILRYICLSLVATFIMVACSSKSSTSTSTETSKDSVAINADSVDLPALLIWKASQGMPIYAEEIDSVIAYFDKADQWAGIHLAGVSTRRQFDSIEAAYLATFQYIEPYSMILERYADIVTPEQMDRLQAIALSMGDKVDRAALASGIDPATVNPFNSETSDTL